MPRLAHPVQIISHPNSQSKLQMFTVFSGCRVSVPYTEVHQQFGSILGSVNLSKIF